MTKKDKITTNDKTKKGFRKNIDKKDLMKSMTDDDWKRIDKQKQFENVEPGTYGYEIALLNDPVRVGINNELLDIDNSLTDMMDTYGNLTKLKVQLQSGDISEEVRPGVKMTEFELKSFIKSHERSIKKDIQSILRCLGRVRANVGVTSYDREEIFTIDQFNKLVDDVKNQLGEMGYDLFNKKLY